MIQKTPNIRLYNTLTRRKQKFTPLEPGKVGMYTCGPTVYAYAHIGNLRAFLFEDLLKRWLQHQGYTVTHIMNITDVDDKTIKASQAQNIPLTQYTQQYTEAFFQDITQLNIKPANHYPKATDHIPEITTLITTLKQKGYAYKSTDNSTYYKIKKFKNYGKLAHIKTTQLKKTQRTTTDEYTKQQPQDFALWKTHTPEDGNTYWQTIHGKGRPGWHIECSAMSMKYLGTTFDIHCGGVDNIFPHHENEIAQSEAATDKKFVNYWLHNEHLLVEGKKMAKSLGNYYTLRDLTQKGHEPAAIRYLLIATHYRQQLNFTHEALTAAKNTLERLRNFQRRLRTANAKHGNGETPKLTRKTRRQFTQAMNNDLDIATALAALFDYIREVNILLDANQVNKAEANQAQAFITEIDQVLGVIGENREEQQLPKQAYELIEKREQARKTRDWARADEIRQQLRKLGVVIEDTANGVQWHLEE